MHVWKFRMRCAFVYNTYTTIEFSIQHRRETRDERRAHVYIHLNICEKFIWIFLLISMCCIGLFIYHSVCVLCIHMEKIHWNNELPVAGALCIPIFTMLEEEKKNK